MTISKHFGTREPADSYTWECDRWAINRHIDTWEPSPDIQQEVTCRELPGTLALGNQQTYGDLKGTIAPLEPVYIWEIS